MGHLPTHQGSRRLAPTTSSQGLTRLYSVRIFEDGLVVPWVKLIDAANDREAISLALSIRPTSRRELWDGHRLVAEFR